MSKNDPAVSVFFHLCVVSRSRAELSTPVGAFMGSRSYVNLTCSVNLSLCPYGCL